MKNKLKQAEMNNWTEKNGIKEIVDIYRVGKINIRKENIYDNTKGSALLFEARADRLEQGAIKANVLRKTTSAGNREYESALCRMRLELFVEVALQFSYCASLYCLQTDGLLCVGCGKEIETFRHIVIGCDGTRPDAYGGDVHLPEALRFKDAGGKKTCKL